MEGQAHLTFGKKKNEPIVSLHEKSDKPIKLLTWQPPFMGDQSHLTNSGEKKKKE